MQRRLSMIIQKQKFKDWRVMFDEFGKSIDAILVATPDHTHAGVTAHAITLGKHLLYSKNLLTPFCL